MNYERLTDEEAIDILKNDFDAELVEDWRNYIIHAPDVLYYADAYGDLEDAIKLQAFDKTLPVAAHKGLLESGLDLLEAVNVHDLETEYCAFCDTGMWEIEFATGNGYTEREWVDEYGNVTDGFAEYVSSSDGPYWDASEDPAHAPVLCDACSHDLGYDFPGFRGSENGNVRVHYGETDEISGFSVRGNLVRWDEEWECDYDYWTDLWALPGRYEELPKAFVKGTVDEWLDEHGWVEIACSTVQESEQFSAATRLRRRQVEREYRRIAEEWTEANETHPDLDFTYVIESATFGTPSFLVPEEHADALVAEIADLIERRV